MCNRVPVSVQTCYKRFAMTALWKRAAASLLGGGKVPEILLDDTDMAVTRDTTDIIVTRDNMQTWLSHVTPRRHGCYT
jgi:hypothetical protein